MKDRQRKVTSPEKRARIGERIKLAALQAGMTLKALSEAIGINQPLVYQYVRGITNVPLEVLERVASATGVTLEFFDPDVDTRSALAIPAQADKDAAALADPARLALDMRHLQELADAYDSSTRNLPALTHALHELLALCRVRGDRKREAWVEWRLGDAFREAGEFEAARDHLIAARDLFTELELEDYRTRAIFDLAAVQAELGDTEAALHAYGEVATCGTHKLRWHALVNVGGLHYRQHRFEDALRAYAEAARALEELGEEEREAEGLPFIMSGIADIARDTGHYNAAIHLWNQTLAQSTENRQADVYIEALINIAECCSYVGRISEARQRLEQAVALASFLYSDQQRLSVARSLLSDVLRVLGALEDSQREARAAMRIASRSGGPRGVISANLSLAESALAQGRFDQALAHAEEAISEASRAARRLDLVAARNLRARILAERGIASEDGSRQALLEEALEEANRALAAASRLDAAREMMVAHITLARAQLELGRDEAAEAAARAAVEIAESGAIGLVRLLGDEAENLPDTLKQGSLDLRSVFAGRGLDVPALEWQAHYLQGRVLARLQEPEAAFVSMLDAVRALGRLFAGLSVEDAARFHEAHPQLMAVFNDVARYALTDEDRQAANALISSLSTAPGGRLRDLPSLPSS